MFVDVACSYVPLEIIHAAGFTPRRLLPPTAKETGLLPPNYCSYARACAATDDGVPVIFTTCCDALRRCYDVRKARGDRVFILDLPRQAIDTSVRYYRGELRRMAQWLQEISGRPVPDETLQNSFQVYQQLRAKLKQFESAAGINEKFYDLLFAALAEFPEDIFPIFKPTTVNPAGGEPGQKRRRVLLAGTILPDPGILALLAENDAAVTAADFCLGERFYQEPGFSAPDDIWLTLAKAYLGKPPCPRMAGKSSRTFYIQNVLNRLMPDGVIFYGLKFCDHGLYEVPLWRFLCSQREIPFLHLEGEYLSGIPAQLRTRLQAFLETI
ncbi:MAG: 2-hydroxyacyl-CoA dehydratase family protein [Bacillota bacterium]